MTGDMTLRELGRINGIRNYSNVSSHSTKGEWMKKREEFRSRADQKALTVLATDEGKRIARESRVRDRAIEVIEQAIDELSLNLKRRRKVMNADGTFGSEPLVLVTPKDVAMLIDRLQVLIGKPSTISEERNLGISFSGANPDILRAIVDATRGVAPGGAVQSPLPRIEEPRKN